MELPWVATQDPRYVDDRGRLVHDMLTANRYDLTIDEAAARGLFAPTMAEQVVMDLEEHDRQVAYVLGLSHALNRDEPPSAELAPRAAACAHAKREALAIDWLKLHRRRPCARRRGAQPQPHPGGTEQRTFAMGSVTRAGRRVALVNAECWQDDRSKPIALAQMKILLSPAE